MIKQYNAIKVPQTLPNYLLFDSILVRDRIFYLTFNFSSSFNFLQFRHNFICCYFNHCIRCMNIQYFNTFLRLKISKQWINSFLVILQSFCYSTFLLFTKKLFFTISVSKNISLHKLFYPFFMISCKIQYKVKFKASLFKLFCLLDT